MKRFISILLFSTVVLFSGCNQILKGEDYHQVMVTEARVIGQSVDATMNAYDSSVPVTLDSDSVVDVSVMREALNTAQSELDRMSTELLEIKTWDLDRKKDVEEAVVDYAEVTQRYLNHYSSIIDFYAGDFASNLHLVLDFDKELYQLFNDHVDVHNALSATLSSHQ